MSHRQPGERFSHSDTAGPRLIWPADSCRANEALREPIEEAAAEQPALWNGTASRSPGSRAVTTSCATRMDVARSRSATKMRRGARQTSRQRVAGNDGGAVRMVQRSADYTPGLLVMLVGCGIGGTAAYLTLLPGSLW